MVLFCSAREFEALCRDLTGRAQLLRLQAKGGSMYPFIQSGDWVELALGKADGAAKGDVILFSKGGSLYLHRVLRRAPGGLMVKGDMSFGTDGIIPEKDILGMAVSAHRGARRIDLRTMTNRRIAGIAADMSLFMQYPYLFARKLFACGGSLLSRFQGSAAYRWAARKVLRSAVVVDEAGVQDEEQLRDLYQMSGIDIRDGILRTRERGCWLVARRKGRIAGALTLIRDDEDPARRLIFGLEVKLLYRRLGAGRALVEAAMARARSDGAAVMGLLVNRRAKAALALYRSLGFSPQRAPDGLNCSQDELYLSYPFDADAALKKAVQDGMFYPVYKGLQAGGELESLPKASAEKFRQMYYAHITLAAEYAHSVERVLTELESRAIKALLFKGPAVDSLIYDGYVRPRLDLDLSVEEEDFPALEKALRDLGYVPPEEDRDCAVPEYRTSHLFRDGKGELVPVHVHEHLINNMFLTVDGLCQVDMARVWDESRPFNGYRHIFVLQPELNILYLCDHALKHDFDQRVFLFEIKELLSAYAPDFSWEKLRGLAARFGLARPAYYGFYFAKQAVLADIPAVVLEQLKPARFTRGELRFLKEAAQGKSRRYASYAVYIAMRKGLARKVFYIYKTLFPPGFTLKGYCRRICGVMPR